VERFWYRHWLEMRIIVWICCAMTMITAIGFGFVVYNAPGYFATTGKLITQVARYEAMREMAGGPELTGAAFHALITAFVALWATCGLSGYATPLGMPSSLRMTSPRHASIYFTLSLPVSRRMLFFSRTIAALGGLTFVLAASLLAHVLVLLLIRQPVPLPAMVGTTMMGAAGGLGFMALSGVVAALTTENIGGMFTGFAAFAVWLTQRGWNETVRFVSLPRASMFIFLVISSVGLVALAAALTQRKDA
jgi:hypothetical protein